MENLTNHFIEHKAAYVSVLVALYELFVRIRPTKYNWSIVDRIVAIFGEIVPNLVNDGAGFSGERFEVDLDYSEASSKQTVEEITSGVMDGRNIRKKLRWQRFVNVFKIILPFLKPLISKVLNKKGITIPVLLLFIFNANATVFINVDNYMFTPSTTNAYLIPANNGMAQSVTSFGNYDNYLQLINNGTVRITLSFDSASDTTYIIKSNALDSYGLKIANSITGTDTGFISIYDVTMNNSGVIARNWGLLQNDTMVNNGGNYFASYSFVGNGIKLNFIPAQIGTGSFVLILTLQKSNSNGLDVVNNCCTDGYCCPTTNELLEAIEFSQDSANLALRQLNIINSSVQDVNDQIVAQTAILSQDVVINLLTPIEAHLASIESMQQVLYFGIDSVFCGSEAIAATDEDLATSINTKIDSLYLIHRILGVSTFSDGTNMRYVILTQNR